MIGIDPGVNTGFASLAIDLPNPPVLYHAFASKLPLHVAGYISEHLLDNKHHPILAVVIEDFVGQGLRDTHVKTSIAHLGFFRLWSEYMGLQVVVQAPQIRKAFLSEAEKLAGHISRHAVDATAHVLAYTWEKWYRELLGPGFRFDEGGGVGSWVSKQ